MKRHTKGKIALRPDPEPEDPWRFSAESNMEIMGAPLFVIRGSQVTLTVSMIDGLGNDRSDQCYWYTDRPDIEQGNGRRYVFTAATPGRYLVVCEYTDVQERIIQRTCVFDVE